MEDSQENYIPAASRMSETPKTGTNAAKKGKRWQNREKDKANGDKKQQTITNYYSPSALQPNQQKANSAAPLQPTTTNATFSSSSSSLSAATVVASQRSGLRKRKGAAATASRPAKNSKSVQNRRSNRKNNATPTSSRASSPFINGEEEEEDSAGSEMEIDSPPETRAVYDSDSDVESEYFRDTIPTMSIHRIIVDRLVNDENFRRSSTAPTIEEQAMLQLLEKKANPRQEPFEPMDNIPIKVSENDKKNYFGGDMKDFEVRLFVQETKPKDTLLVHYGSDKSPCAIHKIWFFYRPGDLFALTTGKAWSVVHEYADFNFPNTVAARLGDDKGPLSMEGKVLAGPLTNTKRTSKDAFAQTPNDRPMLPSKYKFALRDRASIFKFKVFEKERKQDVKSYVECSVSLIRFSKTFAVNDYPLILHHLSTIAKGEKTYKYFDEDEDSEVPVQDQTTQRLNSGINNNGEDESESESQVQASSQSSSQASTIDSEVSMEEKDTSVYKNYFVRVLKETYDELEIQLAELFENAINLNRRRSPDSTKLLRYFNLSHKYIADFCEASSYVLRNSKGSRGQGELPTLPASPTLTDVVNIISKNSNDYFLSLHHYDNSNGFKKYKQELDKIFIDYYSSSSGPASDVKKSGPLLSFVDGVILQKGNYYWKINNCWYSVDESYVSNIHAWTTGFMKDNLLDKGESALNIKWPRSRTGRDQSGPRRDLRAEYVEQCINSNPSSFFPGLQVSTVNSDSLSKLFDLLHIDRETNQITLYFFSTDFEGQTKGICKRIFKCEMEIFKFEKSKKGDFKKYYETHFQPRNIHHRHFSIKEFAHYLLKVQIIYTLVKTEPKKVRIGLLDNYLGNNNQQNRLDNVRRREKKVSLVDESNIPKEVNVTVLMEILEAMEDGVNEDKLNLTEMYMLCEEITHCSRRDFFELSDYDRREYLAKWIYNKLKENKYIRDNKVTPQLLYCSCETFDLDILFLNEGQERIKEKLYFGVVSKLKTKFTALPAKFELKELTKTIDKYQDMSFSLCEIEQEEEEEQQQQC